MPIIKVELDKRVKGSLMEREDWWHLCHNTEPGEQFVEHEWDHVNAYKVSEQSSGTEVISVEQWLNGPGSQGKLDAAMAKINEKTG